MNPSDPDDQVLVDDTERWFLQRGVPHFISDYKASEDVFTRMAPFLALLLLVELSGAARRTLPWWVNVGGLITAVVIAVGGWALVNRLRKRPLFKLPDTVGGPELAFFVLVPGFVRWYVAERWQSALVLIGFNLVVLAVVYLVASYGIIPLLRWALGFTGRQISSVIGLFGRSMPLLLLFSIALFINTEVWQVASTLDGWLYWATALFFLAVGVSFLALRLPPELRRIRDEVDAESPVDRCAGTPLADRAQMVELDGPPPTLTKRQESNVLLVLFFSQAVQILLVTLTLTLFFLIFGLVAIRPETINAWLGDVVDADVLFQWRVFGQDILATRALLHVAGFLGILGGFYFTVYVITDATYREEFFTEIAEEVRQSLAVRRVYLTLVDGACPPAPTR